jgi:hypothetical protein
VPYTASKVTPVLLVSAIEPCLPFWDRLGWTKVVDVPHGDVLGFAILVKDGVEIMYQTSASVEADIPALAGLPTGGAFLFIEVDDLDAVIAATADATKVFPRRKAFYGMEEIGLREPGGNSVTFAMKSE